MTTFRIRHATQYRYSAPVYLDPHRVYLLPRPSPALAVESHALHTEPAPSGQSIVRDAAGELVHAMWFGGNTRMLSIEAISFVEALDFNPFNFLVYPIECAYLPFAYPAAELPALAPCLGPPVSGGAVHAFANRVVQASGGQTVTSLIGLCTKIQREFTYQPREHGAPYPPEQTLQLKTGTCRDFTVLFIAAARALGLAARYVSGYVLDIGEGTQHELHAWAEVYVPGAGWLGFDPTLGIVASSSHVAIAAAPEPAQTAPIQGTYRGSVDVTVTFEVDIAPCVSQTQRQS